MTMATRTIRNAILMLTLWVASAAHAQVDDLHITARKYDGRVLVKCMPTNAATWYRMMQGGAQVTLNGRAAITLRHGSPEAFAATKVDSDWKATLAKLATEVPAPKVKEDDLDAVVRAGKDLERHYLAWILLTAYHPELSSLSGMQFELSDDGKAISGTVNVPGVQTKTFRIERDDLLTDLPGIPVTVQAGDKAATLRWSHAPLNGYAMAYRVDRSRDGKSFAAVAPPVLYDRSSKGVADDPMGMEWVDPLPANDETWHYRVVALDAFGFPSVDNRVLTVTPREDPTLPPFGAIRIDTKNNGTSTLNWTYPMLDHLKGFQVIHSVNGALGPYELSHTDVLPANTRSFTHAWDPQADVHYRIMAVDKEGNATASELIYRAIADTLPPDVPADLRVEVDSTGLVRIAWNPVQDKDLKGYRVFKSFQADRGFVQLTRVPIADTMYADTLSLQRLDKQVYYQVVSLDGSFNQSAPSAAAMGLMADVVAPTPPLLVGADVEEDKRVILIWNASSSPDLAYYEVQYRSPGDSLFHQLYRATSTEHNHTDPGFKEVPHSREYRVLAVDSAGNSSASNLRRAVRRTLPSGPEAPTELRATNEDGKVTLSWKLAPDQELSHLLVYVQSAADTRPRLVDRSQALDRTTSPEPAREGDRYRVQAVSAKGMKSTLSEAVEVRMP